MKQEHELAGPIAKRPRSKLSQPSDTGRMLCNRTGGIVLLCMVERVCGMGGRVHAADNHRRQQTRVVAAAASKEAVHPQQMLPLSWNEPRIYQTLALLTYQGSIRWSWKVLNEMIRQVSPDRPPTECLWRTAVPSSSSSQNCHGRA